MELKGQRYTIDASILLALVAVILCSRGLFSNEWWRDEQGFHHDIFTVVNCHGNVCVLGNSGSDTWIVFVQVMGLLQMTMLIAAVVNNIMVVVYANRLMSVVGLISLAIAWFASVMQTVVLTWKYFAISQGFMSTTLVPKSRVLYTTLPSGLCAISGIFSIPAAVALVVWRIRESREDRVQKSRMS